MLSFSENTEKSADARFFRSIYSFFSLFEFRKNPKNVRKIVFFHFFPYALRHLLQNTCIMLKANNFVNNC
jgi:hypothetical protein